LVLASPGEALYTVGRAGLLARKLGSLTIWLRVVSMPFQGFKGIFGVGREMAYNQTLTTGALYAYSYSSYDSFYVLIRFGSKIKSKGEHQATDFCGQREGV